MRYFFIFALFAATPAFADTTAPNPYSDAINDYTAVRVSEGHLANDIDAMNQQLQADQAELAQLRKSQTDTADYWQRYVGQGK